MKTLMTTVLLAGSLIAIGGEISDYHFKHAREKLGDHRNSRSHDEVNSTNHGITEIGIERSGSVWGGPIYTFVARSDGTFRYKGDKDVERTGEISGSIPVWQFHQLAKFIRDSGYMEFEESYTRIVADNRTTYTMVLMNGKRKTVSNYANAGPIKLWAIEELIDELMARAEWKPGLPKAPAPLLPKVTRYDSDPVLRAAYLDSFHKGYVDAWEQKESLPVFGPASDADKARVFGYTEGMIAGRAALGKWFGTNNPGIGPKAGSPKL
jgi:hypothetical protein